MKPPGAGRQRADPRQTVANGRKVVLLVSGILSAVFLLLATAFASWSLTSVADTLATTGTVEQLRRSRGAHPEVSYAVEGTQYTVEGKIGSSLYDLEVGDPVEVLYKRKDPKRAIINTTLERWGMTIGFGSAGLVATLLLLATWRLGKPSSQ